MKALSLIASILCLIASFVFAIAAIGGFFVLGVSYVKAITYIVLMGLAIKVSMNLLFFAQEEEK